MIGVSRDFVGGRSLVLSQELAKFKIHRPCESGDITFFICRVTTISVSRDSVGEFLSLNLGSIGLAKVKIESFLICHVIMCLLCHVIL